MFDSFTTRGRIRNILKLLREEREILRNGPLSDLTRVAMRRDKLVEGLTNGTVELAASVKHSTRTIACPDCGADGHASDAVHCKHCGARLD